MPVDVPAVLHAARSYPHAQRDVSSRGRQLRYRAAGAAPSSAVRAPPNPDRGLIEGRAPRLTRAAGEGGTRREMWEAELGCSAPQAEQTAPSGINTSKPGKLNPSSAKRSWSLLGLPVEQGPWYAQYAHPSLLPAAGQSAEGFRFSIGS